MTDDYSSTVDIGVAAWEGLLRTHAALVPVLANEVEARTGIPLSWYDVLFELKNAPDHQLRMTELGERVVLSRTRVSRIVDEMARAGLLERVPDPDDGRAAFATLTPEGKRMQRRIAPIYLAAIQTHFVAFLSAEELAILVRVFGRVLAGEITMHTELAQRH